MSQTGSPASDLLVVGNSSDDPFAIDVAYAMGQGEDIADLISMKSFANSEFCPRFISDEEDFANIGNKLEGQMHNCTVQVRVRADGVQSNLLICAASESRPGHPPRAAVSR